MIEKRIICDKCGKEITNFNYYNKLKFTLRYWHGGSIGGSEDDENFDIDLCEECANSLSWLLNKWIKGNRFME